MPERRIIYCMSGAPHVPYLAVSLWSLRRYWGGPIDVFVWPESYDFVKHLERDFRLGIVCHRHEPEYRGKNSQFLDKIRVAQSMNPHDAVVYLDADTTVHGHLDRLFDGVEISEFAATQFNNWTTGSKAIRGRIASLRQFDLPKEAIDASLLTEWPSLNGGIWAARPDSPILNHWYDWTMQAKGTFIADEKVLHILQPIYVPDGEMQIVGQGGQFNCSPKFRPSALKLEDVVIWHYHGDCNVRPRKSRVGYSLWWGMFQQVLRMNLGRVREWYRDCGNKWIRAIEQDQMVCG